MNLNTKVLKVIVTDYAWRDLEVERGIFASHGIELVAATEQSPEGLRQAVVNADAILTNWRRVTAKVLSTATRCKAVGRYGVGLDNIDVRYATKHGIVVTNVPEYCVDEVSEHAMALALALARNVAFFDRAMKSGVYSLSEGTPMYRMRGKIFGVIGHGSIGRALAEKASLFGMRVVVVTRNARTEGVEHVRLDEALAQSDFLSVHVPLTDETHHMFRYETFGRMKPTAFFINTARGGLVDQTGLLRALEERLIAGAALDVLASEPPDRDDPLVRHPRVITTPHAAFWSEDSIEILRRTAAQQMTDVLTGKLPYSIKNPDVLRSANLRMQLSAQSG
jgi:D-3-phosphoglycerate dehydrogenase